MPQFQGNMFGEPIPIGDVRTKILELYSIHSGVVDDDRVLIGSFWLAYDNLQSVLGDRTDDFLTWLFNPRITKPETIRRSRQKLTEDKIIEASPEVTKERAAMEERMRRYFSGR